MDNVTGGMQGEQGGQAKLCSLLRNNQSLWSACIVVVCEETSFLIEIQRSTSLWEVEKYLTICAGYFEEIRWIFNLDVVPTMLSVELAKANGLSGRFVEMSPAQAKKVLIERRFLPNLDDQPADKIEQSGKPWHPLAEVRATALDIADMLKKKEERCWRIDVVLVEAPDGELVGYGVYGFVFLKMPPAADEDTLIEAENVEMYELERCADQLHALGTAARLRATGLALFRDQGIDPSVALSHLSNGLGDGQSMIIGGGDAYLYRHWGKAVRPITDWQARCEREDAFMRLLRTVWPVIGWSESEVG